MNSEQWNEVNLQRFWGEVAPCDHVVQIYENDKVFMESLEGFAGTGLITGDSIVIIATAEHLQALEARLIKQGLNVADLAHNNRYLALNAEEALSTFIVNSWPDEALFNTFINSVLERAQPKNGKGKVRAFGEMVALLWQQGLKGATVQLEALWNRLQQNQKFTLFCAYPKVGFTQDINASIDCICSVHTKMISGEPRPSTQIYYKAVSS